MLRFLQKATQPLRRKPGPEFDFSNTDDYQFDVEGEFDVYTMESAMPTIDWDSIEAHLEATQEEERRRDSNPGLSARKQIRSPVDQAGDKPVDKAGDTSRPSW
ncbi:hypothetical protein FHG87_007108 [Trinorchestia longiramus]|nr:hypothetical protein FHG87_007108 [Trinorchestia longiramus]